CSPRVIDEAALNRKPAVAIPLGLIRGEQRLECLPRRLRRCVHRPLSRRPTAYGSLPPFQLVLLYLSRFNLLAGFVAFGGLALPERVMFVACLIRFQCPLFGPPRSGRQVCGRQRSRTSALA